MKVYQLSADRSALEGRALSPFACSVGLADVDSVARKLADVTRLPVVVEDASMDPYGARLWIVRPRGALDPRCAHADVAGGRCTSCGGAL